MNQKTRQLSEGALMISLCALMLLLNQQSGLFFEDTFYWVLGFPLLVYASKHGIKRSLIVWFASILMGFLFGSIATWFYLFVALITGIIYGSGVYYKLSNKALYGISFISSALVMLMTTWVLANLFAMNLQDSLNEFEEVFAMFDMQGVDAIAMVVAVNVLFAVLISILTHLFAQRLLHRLDITHP